MTFVEELADRIESLTSRQRADIKKRVRTPLNRQLRDAGGRDNTLREGTDLELAFLDLVYPKVYESLRALARKDMESYFDGRRVSPKLHDFVLPKPGSTNWEITFAESFMGPVVYFTMKGWKPLRRSLIG